MRWSVRRRLKLNRRGNVVHNSNDEIEQVRENTRTFWFLVVASIGTCAECCKALCATCLAAVCVVHHRGKTTSNGCPHETAYANIQELEVPQRRTGQDRTKTKETLRHRE